MEIVILILVVLKFKLTNKCKSYAELKNLNLIIEDWKYNDLIPIINGVEFDRYDDEMTELSIFKKMNFNKINLNLNSQICYEKNCNWVKIRPNAELKMRLIFKTTWYIRKMTISRIYVERPDPDIIGNLFISFKGIPDNFQGQLRGQIINPNFKQLFNLSANNTDILLYNIKKDTIFTLIVQGIGDPFTGYLGRINSVIKKNNLLNQTEIFVFKKLEIDIYNVNLIPQGYKGYLSLNFSFSSNLENYVYIQTKEYYLESNKVINFPLYETISVNVDKIEGWNIKISPTQITSAVNQIFINIMKVMKVSISGYYESWSTEETSTADKNSLSKIPNYIKYIIICFAKPDLIYNDFNDFQKTTGLQFHSNFTIIKEAIQISKQNNPDQKFLLSLGGPIYSWENVNFNNISKLISDLDLDGINIHYEKMPQCENVNTDSIKCSTDEEIKIIVNQFKVKLPENKLISASVYSIGAYGTSEYSNNINLPTSDFAGMWVNPLKEIGNNLDILFLMSYDASKVYSPTQAFQAYRKLFSKELLIGLEVPPENWGDNELTKQDAIKYSKYSMDNQGSGVFIYSFQKTFGKINCNDYLEPICNLYNLSNCTQKLPLH